MTDSLCLVSITAVIRKVEEETALSDNTSGNRDSAVRMIRRSSECNTPVLSRASDGNASPAQTCLKSLRTS